MAKRNKTVTDVVLAIVIAIGALLVAAYLAMAKLIYARIESMEPGQGQETARKYRPIIAPGLAATLFVLLCALPSFLSGEPVETHRFMPAATAEAVSPTPAPSVEFDPAPTPKAPPFGSGAYGGCPGDEYRSTDGSCVHRPYRTNQHVDGETAVCGDGTHSMSHHHQGTCSHHGGVSHWD